MPNISPIYSNITPNINYASDEASSGQNGTQKTEYQGRNIVKNSEESAPVILRHGEGTVTNMMNDASRRYAGIDQQVDATAPPLPPKPTLVTQEILPMPAEINSHVSLTLSNKINNLHLALASQAAAINHDDYYSQLDSQRKADVLLAKSTLVEAPDGKKLAANRVQIGNENVAIISEYPKADCIESHLKMLANNRTPVLVVIASNDDIAAGNKDLPAYFKQDGVYGSISTKITSKTEQLSAGKLTYNQYQLKITEDHKSYRVPVIHISNWDGGKAINNEGLKTLINSINNVKDQRIDDLKAGKSSALNDSNKVLPVIHGSKGYERAGFLVAATELAKSDNTLSLETVMFDVQASTTPNIFNKKAPVQLLAQFENVNRNKRSLDRMEEAATGDKITMYTEKMSSKLQKKVNDGEKTAFVTPLTPAKLAAEDIQKAKEQGKAIFEKLEAEFRQPHVAMHYIGMVRNQRFKNIPTASATIVKVPKLSFSENEQLLPANRVKINQKEVAIACQYPTPQSLENYFKMFMANRTPALVVLASDNDISIKLPNYFSQSGEYGDISVEVIQKGEKELADGLHCRDYELKLKLNTNRSAYGLDKKWLSPVTIPVSHVYDWADLTASSNKGLIALAEHINMATENSRNAHNDKSLLPVIHCRAGVGRTGQLLGTMELLKAENQQSLESIVRDMRSTRAPQMVQTREQMQTLAVLAAELNKPISDQ